MCVSVQSCDHRNVVRVLQVVHELNVSLVTSSCGLLPSFFLLSKFMKRCLLSSGSIQRLKW